MSKYYTYICTVLLPPPPNKIIQKTLCPVQDKNGPWRFHGYYPDQLAITYTTNSVQSEYANPHYTF